MNREIKFRAWDKEDKRMITHNQEFIPLMVTNWGVMKLSPHHEENLWFLIAYDRFELMQFTGLKDKNGKDIYEGDILKMEHQIVGVGVIEFIGGGFWVKGKNGQFLPAEHLCEIIGNIYSNPDILK